MKTGSKVMCVLMLLTVALATPALATDSIQLETSKRFVGDLTHGQILDVDLVTARTTKAQIIVVRQEEILQNHDLIVGPKGVVDGEHRGAVLWSFEVPADADPADFHVYILVQRFAGKGAPVSYSISHKTADAMSGFRFRDV